MNFKNIPFYFYYSVFVVLCIILNDHGLNGFVRERPDRPERFHFINMNNVHELFNLDNLLIELNTQRLRNVPGVSELLARYNETAMKAVNISEDTPKKPFIVIESVYNAGRRTVTELVAHALGGVYSTNPPKIMQGFSTAFDGMFLRRKYYALSKYAAGNLVKDARQRQPVVMEKYYYDQAVFIIAKTYIDTGLPPPDHAIYKWPPDLLKPDLIFFLNFPDDPTTNLFTQSYKQTLYGNDENYHLPDNQ